MTIEHLKSLQEEVAHQISSTERQCTHINDAQEVIENKLVLLAKSIRRILGEQYFDSVFALPKKALSRRGENRYKNQASPAVEAGGFNNGGNKME